MTTVDTAHLLCEFLEVAVHNILYSRKLYPEAIFAPRKKYGVAVFQSEHPILNEYITHVLKAVQVHVMNNQLKQVLLCINNNNGSLAEKYVFDIIKLQSLSNDRDKLLVKLEQDLRSFCLKLTSSIDALKVLSTNPEFNIILHTTEYSAIAFNCDQEHNEFPWIPINSIQCESLGIIPLHTINTDSLVLQIYIEEYNI